MIPNHPAVVEAASWRIVTELCRRTPALSIYQYHPGGGQNDCLALLHPTLGMVANLNRNGTFHAQRRLDSGEPARDECWPIWEEVTHPPMRDLVNRASAQIGQAVPARLPASVPRVVVYRVITAILALHAFAPVMWSCQGAFIDSSGFEGCGGHPLLPSFPAAEGALRAESQTDPERIGVGTWLVLRGDEPLLCLREDGRGWTLDGEVENLVSTYGRSRRILAVVYPLLETIADLYFANTWPNTHPPRVAAELSCRPMGFQLFAPQWFGWQMLPGYGGGRCLSWFSPIHLRRVTPLKTGRGLLDIEFLHALYAEGVQDQSVRLKVIHHGDNFLAGRIVPPDGAPNVDNRMAIISHIEFGWLAQFCPQLVEAFPPESLDALQAHSVSMYLDGLFFQNPPLPPQPENLDDGSENAWLLTCALRFDGYTYGLDHGVEREVHEVGLRVLRGKAVPRSLSVGKRMTLMFLLQRGLMKEGVRSKTDAGWKAFRELFLKLAAEPIPATYRMQPWHGEWTRLFAPILPVGKKLIQHLHDTCHDDGQH